MGGYHIDSISSKLTIAGGSVSLREDMKELEARQIAEQYKARIGGTVLWRIRREKPTTKESLFS